MWLKWDVVVVQSLSCVQLFATPWTAVCQVHLSFTPGVCTNLCPLSHWCRSTISSSTAHFSSYFSIFPSIRVFSSESALHLRWPKYWSFSFSISPSNEYSGLISYKTDWFDFLAVQGTLRSLLQHQNLKGSRLLRLRRWRTSKAKLLSEFVKC